MRSPRLDAPLQCAPAVPGWRTVRLAVAMITDERSGTFVFLTEHPGQPSCHRFLSNSEASFENKWTTDTWEQRVISGAAVTPDRLWRVHR